MNDAVKVGAFVSVYGLLKLLGLAVWIIGGIHAFRYHGVIDGVIAVGIPPWACYRAIEGQLHKDEVSRIELAKADKDDMRALQATMNDAVNVRDAILSRADMTEIKEFAAVGLRNANSVTQEVLVKLDPSYPGVWKRNVIGYFEEVNQAADAGDIARLRYSDTVFTHYVEWVRTRFPDGIVKTKTRRTQE